MTKYKSYIKGLYNKSQQQPLDEIEAGILACPSRVVSLEIEIAKLDESDKMLRALEAAGVDNWDGYDIAIDIRKDME